MTTNKRTFGFRICSIAFVLTLAFAGLCRAAESKTPIRVGMIGLDTSHVITFTKIINDPQATGDLADIRIVAAYPGGSPTFPLSFDRVEGFTQQVREMGIEIVDSIPHLLEEVDVVMLESVDGSQHLEQVEPVFAAGKRVFIDKPFAASLVDAIAIAELGKKHSAAYFSSSPKRFSRDLVTLVDEQSVGKVIGCDVYGASKSVPNHPDLFWYGVHGSEMLFTVLGPGCASVTAQQTSFSEQVSGTWHDGRIGTFRGIREAGGKSGFGATVFGTKRIAQASIGSDKDGLSIEIARFFKTGEAPVPPEVTVELFAFMEAAEESKRQGGKPVIIEDVMQAARTAAFEKLGGTE
ncbi:MAG: Gfo/Idh/MocA family oxidoreductase [Pirellulaceae bacterium]|jgi:predicted dehydrogenase|nr:Gfo/Idh/MocA family oxidoreductase [Pirellulaceae bacterium]